MKKSELRKMIREELLKESDYSFDDININLYTHANGTKQLGISSSAKFNGRVDLKVDQLSKLISILKKIH